MPKTYYLEREQWFDRPRPEVFAFFADAMNLEAITPASLHFHVVSAAPIEMRVGTLIDYQLRLFGVPFSWQTRIETFEPPERFVDLQIRGPYRLWRHTHRFIEDQGGTRMFDRVEYQLPLGPLGLAAHRVFVRRTLAKIFDYRRDQIAALVDGRSSRCARGD